MQFPLAMEIIQSPLDKWQAELPAVRLRADRLTLAKRRWRGRADDGAEFGFDLVAPVSHGAAFFADAAAVYFIEQKPEPVLEVALIAKAAPVARLGWTIGNLHFQIQVTDECIRIPDDPALRQLFAREKIPFKSCDRIFVPFAKSHNHGGAA
jgi:urease accessory protein